MKGERRGAPLKGHAHTQTSFGLAAHANEEAKIPPTGLHGGPNSAEPEDTLNEIW